MAILARKQEILAVNTLKKLIKKLITQKAISKDVKKKKKLIKQVYTDTVACFLPFSRYLLKKENPAPLHNSEL